MSIGSGAVLVMVVLAAVAVVVPDPRAAARSARWAAVAGTVAVLSLGWAFAVEDWSLRYVADNARSGVGPALRIAGSWAGPEGSLLVWTVFVAWVAAAVVGRGDAPASARGLGRRLLARFAPAVTIGYGVLVATVASPFERLVVPAVDGLGLQPVLEHPAMVWHPPLLYAGLVGLLHPTAVALAAVAGGRRPDMPSGPLRLALALLGLGLITGAVWANVELGWGGYWAWDPIESAGLVAWLCGAAALHAGARTTSVPPGVPAAPVVPPRMAAALAAACGLAVVWATTLTRTGLVSSVHAFADRPALRIGLLVVAAAASTLLAAAVIAVPGRLRPPPPVAGPAPGTLDRRRAAAVVMAGAVIVAVGTYEPLIEAAVNGDAVAIAGRYYSRLLWPVVIVGAGVAVAADRRWVLAAVGAAAGAIVVTPAAGPFAVAVGLAGGALGAGGLARRPVAAAVAHAGVGLILVGVAGTMATVVDVATVRVGETVDVAGVAVTHHSIELVEGTATTAAVATVAVDGTIVNPRLVAYELRGVSTTEVASLLRGVDETQILLLDGDAEQGRYRVNHLPRVGLVWLGAVVTALGLVGGLGQGRRRLRASSSDSVDSEPPPPVPSPPA